MFMMPGEKLVNTSTRIISPLKILFRRKDAAHLPLPLIKNLRIIALPGEKDSLSRETGSLFESPGLFMKFSRPTA